MWYSWDGVGEGRLCGLGDAGAFDGVAVDACEHCADGEDAGEAGGHC